MKCKTTMPDRRHIQAYWLNLCRATTDETKFNSSRTPKKTVKPKNYSLGKNFPGISLSQRETECMALLVDGYTNAKVSTQLGLSVRTVESYLVNIRKKLNCKTKSKLILKIQKSDLKDELVTIRRYILKRTGSNNE